MYMKFLQWWNFWIQKAIYLTWFYERYISITKLNIQICIYFSYFSLMTFDYIISLFWHFQIFFHTSCNETECKSLIELGRQVNFLKPADSIHLIWVFCRAKSMFLVRILRTKRFYKLRLFYIVFYWLIKPDIFMEENEEYYTFLLLLSFSSCYY